MYINTYIVCDSEQKSKHIEYLKNIQTYEFSF